MTARPHSPLSPFTAMMRARVEVSLGAVPVIVSTLASGDILSTAYSVPSRAGDGTTYAVLALSTLRGLSVTCTCPAGMAGVPCWHRAAVLLVEAGEIRAIEQERGAAVA